nr:MAG TPA_asm: hypothetical protein [Caudoviricetes sp.]
MSTPKFKFIGFNIEFFILLVYNTIRKEGRRNG